MPMRIKSILNHDKDPRVEAEAETRKIIRRRKGRPHVSSACFHCKKSHLACDRNRPCNRCMSTGKGDECYDTEHKKRGRPRTKSSTENEHENVSCTSLGIAVGQAAFASVFPTIDVVSNPPLVTHQPTASNSRSNNQIPPILPTFQPPSQVNPEPVNQHELSKKIQPKVVSILDRKGNLHSTPNSDSVLGLFNRLSETGSILDLTFESDKLKLLEALWNQPAYTPNSNFNMELPTTHLCIHFLDLNSQYSLFDVYLSPSLLEVGLIECTISKFEFSTLISSCPQADQNLFRP